MGVFAETSQYTNILGISGNGNPWYWYKTRQQSMEISFEGGYIIFILGDEFNGQPIITGIASEHDGEYFLIPFVGDSRVWRQLGLDQAPTMIYEGDPIPMEGYDTLEDAIDSGGFDSNDAGGLITPDKPYGQPVRVPNGQPTSFATYGILPMNTPPAEPNDNFTGGRPNIWQLTKMPQPALADPSLPWNDFRFIDARSDLPFNPYVPNSAASETAAKTFVDFWNRASTSMNSLEAIMNGMHPDWAFGTPFLYTGPDDHSFLAGLTVGVGIFPLVLLNPATSIYIGCDQLDTKIWDTSKYPPQRRGT